MERLTATQRFDPGNQRLRSVNRMGKMSLQEIEGWMAFGIMTLATLQRVDALVHIWRGPPHAKRMAVVSLRVWCQETMQKLESARNIKLRAGVIKIT